METASLKGMSIWGHHSYLISRRQSGKQRNMKPIDKERCSPSFLCLFRWEGSFIRLLRGHQRLRYRPGSISRGQ
uniref:Uncharacterized protein n=1 Tax=Utricularia reniformis TaxID=192314 RepID=A0A1Y0B1M5_9LAMI|nr:hypothetical protein AEK19_MT1139 [Utricularia reniformis]ART31355.1 hypothetical protein AEK19_MT1139 [Utricularia reniformis]